MKIKKKIRLLEEIQKKHCKYCYATENLTLDHKVPISLGGKNEVKNIQVLCRRCNGIKGRLSHGQVRGLFRWFLGIQESRELKGKKKFK